MKERQRRMSVSLPPELAQFAREQAKKDGTNVSWVVAKAIKGYRREVRREQTLTALALNEGL